MLVAILQVQREDVTQPERHQARGDGESTQGPAILAGRIHLV